MADKEKMPNTYDGLSTKPAGGGRFAKETDQLEEKEGYSEKVAKAVAAKIGRQKYGAKKMAKYAAQGRKRAGEK